MCEPDNPSPPPHVAFINIFITATEVQTRAPRKEGGQQEQGQHSTNNQQCTDLRPPKSIGRQPPTTPTFPHSSKKLRCSQVSQKVPFRVRISEAKYHLKVACTIFAILFRNISITEKETQSLPTPASGPGHCSLSLAYPGIWCGITLPSTAFVPIFILAPHCWGAHAVVCLCALSSSLYSTSWGSTTANPSVGCRLAPSKPSFPALGEDSTQILGTPSLSLDPGL